jgi:hypothetical protein
MKTKKHSILIFSLIMLSISSFSQHLSKPVDTMNLLAADTIAEADTYELRIFDPGFDSWFNKVKKPESHYSQQYLESWNMKLVSQWNNLLNRSQQANCAPSTYIHYDQTVDYGLTLNYRLFYYFRYMQRQCKLFDTYPSTW